MKPQPWTDTKLSNFINCPRQMYERDVAKSVPFVTTPELEWGNHCHKEFEERQKNKRALALDLSRHEVFMKTLDGVPGEMHVENRIALTRSLEPCTWFVDDVWFRGKIDWYKKHVNHAYVVDYKTGKQKNNFRQLKAYGLYIFARYPDVASINADYYWTQSETTTGEHYTRDQIPELWAEFLPDLKQYAEAFKTDTWQPRQSGLCHGWCPVQTCEFWKPKKMAR